MTIKIYILLVLPLALVALHKTANGHVLAQKWNIDLYGHQIIVNANSDAFTAVVNTGSADNAQASIIKLLQMSETDSLYAQLIRIKQQYNMDDLAFVLLMKKVNESIWPKSTTSFKNVIMLALLQKHGVDIIAGYCKGDITVYARTNFLIDNCLFIQRGNKIYYDLSFDQRKSVSEEVALNLPEQSRSMPLVMNMLTPPSFNAKTEKHITPFEYDGYMYYFTTRINASLTAYYRELPTIAINTVYLNYGVSEQVRQSLIKELKRAVKDMRTEVAVDFILKFTQYAFDYRKDEQVYGIEKFSFPEETLSNRFSDCEDKAMLFATLIHEVLGLKSVALYYKDAQHINVAIQSWNSKIGGNIHFNDENYIVCEPTYKGFNVGQNSLTHHVARLIDW